MLWFLRGLTYPVRGLTFALGRRDLSQLLWGPLLLGVLVLGGELVGLVLAIQHWLRGAGVWLHLLAYGLGIVAAALVFLGLQGVVCAPFCERLSERTEAHCRGVSPPRAGPGAQAASVAHAALRGGVYLAGLLVLFGLGLLVPGVGLLGLFWSAAYAALDALDYPATRRRFSLRRKLALLRRHTGATMGFGLATALFSVVPLVGLLVSPIAAVGGTLLFLDLERDPRYDARP